MIGGECTVRAAEKISLHGSHDGGYRRASQTLEVSAELEVGPKQVQRMVKRVDRKLDGVRQEKVREATLGLPAPWYASKHLAVAVDGSMIRFCDKEEDSISDWGEVKNAVVSGLETLEPKGGGSRPSAAYAQGQPRRVGLFLERRRSRGVKLYLQSGHAPGPREKV